MGWPDGVAGISGRGIERSKAIRVAIQVIFITSDCVKEPTVMN